MKKMICLLLLSFVWSSLALAEGKNGIGIVAGEPSGITFQSQLDNKRFLDFYFAYNWDKEWMFMGDYKVRVPGLLAENILVVPYIGGGFFLNLKDKKHGDDIAIGVRVPIGADWKVPETPIVLFGELVPGLKIIKATEGELQLGIGGRFFY